MVYLLVRTGASEDGSVKMLKTASHNVIQPFEQDTPDDIPDQTLSSRVRQRQLTLLPHLYSDKYYCRAEIPKILTKIGIVNLDCRATSISGARRPSAAGIH